MRDSETRLESDLYKTIYDPPYGVDERSPTAPIELGGMRPPVLITGPRGTAENSALETVRSVPMPVGEGGRIGACGGPGSVKLDLFGDHFTIEEPEPRGSPGVCFTIIEEGEPRASGEFASVSVSKPEDLRAIAGLLLRVAGEMESRR